VSSDEERRNNRVRLQHWLRDDNEIDENKFDNDDEGGGNFQTDLTAIRTAGDTCSNINNNNERCCRICLVSHPPCNSLVGYLMSCLCV
jgi:hypothetical protein